jgi:O-acetyl-ADP-ribose deacetylase (regulator of RNase III)
MYKEIEGNLITLAKEAKFDVIAHGCNCFCTMGAGIAPQMAEAFGCDTYEMESTFFEGDINKLGAIDWEELMIREDGKIIKKRSCYTLPELIVVNAYTQYDFGKNHLNGSSQPLDYEALILCMRKINATFKGKKIGLPQIGCGLAGGDWTRVKQIIQTELKDCDVTIVIYKP